MKYCDKCGSQLADDAKFCSVCGNRMGGAPQVRRSSGPSNGSYTAGGNTPGTARTANNGRYTNNVNNVNTANAGGYNNFARSPGRNSSGPANEAVQTVVKKMRTSATIWLVIGIIQIVTGICTICFGYGVAPIVLGIYNLIQSSTERKNAARFENEPVGIVNYFEANGTMIIIFLIVNFFLGAIFGIIGSIYDLTVRSSVLSLRTQLLNAENTYMNTGAY